MNTASPLRVTSSDSAGVEGPGIQICLARFLATLRWTVTTATAWLLLSTATLVSAADNGNDFEVIANKKWEDISNDELICVFRQHFDDKRILKFKPGFCIYRGYYIIKENPSVIVVGIGLIDLREREHLGSLEACIDEVLLGALGGFSGRWGYFTKMGFSEESAWKLATTFVRILYSPEMGYGSLKFRERGARVTEILKAFRRRREINAD